MSQDDKRKKSSRRPRKNRQDGDREIVLLCNPRAGGRWHELADILDSQEARLVRRIVTDSVEDVGPALKSLSPGIGLVCIYGGDGTIQRILDMMFTRRPPPQVPLVFIGGGTMNVTARWCGMSSKPARNFREVVQAYTSGELLLREVPLLQVRQGDTVHYGFTFGIGPIIRVLDTYERSDKGKLAALSIAGQTVVGAWTGHTGGLGPDLHEMEAEVLADDQNLPYHRFAGIFANVTGTIHIGVQPFISLRSRDTFHYLAYAVDRREVVVLLPLLVRGWLPIDSRSLLKPISTWRRIALSYLGKDTFPTDPRYLNGTAHSLQVATPETVYTVDGEIFASNGAPLTVELGPEIRLAVSSSVRQGATARLVQRVTRPPRPPISPPSSGS